MNGSALLLLTIFVVNTIAMPPNTRWVPWCWDFSHPAPPRKTTFRTAARAGDRSTCQAKRRGIFHGRMENELKQANLFGWPLAVVLGGARHRLLHDELACTRNVRRGGFRRTVRAGTGVAWQPSPCWSGWCANYDERPLWIVRTTPTMIVARPLCALLQIGLALLAILAWAQWPGLLMVFDMSLPMFCTAWIVYSFGRIREWTSMTGSSRASIRES